MNKKIRIPGNKLSRAKMVRALLYAGLDEIKRVGFDKFLDRVEATVPRGRGRKAMSFDEKRSPAKRVQPRGRKVMKLTKKR